MRKSPPILTPIRKATRHADAAIAGLFRSRWKMAYDAYIAGYRAALRDAKKARGK